ncbi:MAG: hypothetical protein ACJ780_27620 [Solirubrobacteraceae bacterium]
MTIKRAMLALAVAATAVAIPVAGAQGGILGTKAHAKFGRPLHIKAAGKKGKLKVSYNCDQGDALWISAKQTKTGARDDALKKEGSSKVAATWLDSHRNPIRCDGARHTARFVVDKVEKGTKGKLRPGLAWVQFCITLNEKKLTLSHSHWVEVE